MNSFFALVLASSDASTASNPIAQLIPFAIIGALFYFLLIRPQRRRQAEQQSMLRRVSVGDEIITIGGFHGTIVQLDDDTMILSLAPGVEVKMARNAVSRPVSPLPAVDPLADLDEFDDDDLDEFDDDDDFDDDFGDDFDTDGLDDSGLDGGGLDDGGDRGQAGRDD